MTIRHISSTLAIVLAATALIAGAAAQEPKTGSFEVASVRPNSSGEVSTTITPLVGDTFTAENAALRDLIRYAYQLSDFELVGAPEWSARERFDIRAKAGRDRIPTSTDGLTPERVMLRALLIDRFKLAMHRQNSESPIYALVVVRSDRQPGQQLRATQTDCAALRKVAGGEPPRSAD